MSLIFNFDARQGELIDQVSKTVPTNTNTVIKQTEKGRTGRFDGTAALDFTRNIANGTYSVEFWARHNITPIQGFILDTRTSGGTGYIIITGSQAVVSSSGIIYVDNVQTTAFKRGTYHHVIITGMTMEISNILFGKGYISPADLIGDIIRFRIYEGTLTTQEREALYQEFLNSQSIQRSIIFQKALKEGSASSDVLISTDLTNENADGQTIAAGGFLNDFRVDSGSFLVGEMGKKNDSSEVLGSELLTNSDFSAWTGDNPNNWTVTGEDANNYITESNGHLRSVSDGSSVLGLTQSVSLGKGKLYKLEMKIVNYVSGDIRLYSTGTIEYPATNMGWTANGTYSAYFVAHTTGSANAITLYRYLPAGNDYELEYWSFKEVLSPVQKSIACVTAGDIQIQGIDLSAVVDNGYIKQLDGDLSSDAGDTIDNASNVAYASNVVTISMTAGQVLRNCLITRGS